MKEYRQQLLTGERALFKMANAKIVDSVFAAGESPLKESKEIELIDTTFRWKYPLWYSADIKADNITLVDTARSGIWYTTNIQIENSLIQAPKAFRRSTGITLNHVTFSDAEETLWNCKDVIMNHVCATGNYFGMNSRNLTISDFNLAGNYGFDGAEDVEITNAHLVTKDCFWNCKNVTVRDSTIIGEYLGWNSQNVTFINCTIESNQGLCYMENVKLINCKLIQTDLAFEYSTVEADVTTHIDSIKNPISGTIQAESIGKIIFDDPSIDRNQTVITENDAIEKRA